MPLSIRSRWEIIFLSKHRRGPKLTVSEVAKEVKCDTKTVKHWLQQYESTGDVADVLKSGRTRITNDIEDEKIVALAEENREQSSKQLSKVLKRKGIDVSPRTVRRRLNEAELQSLPPLMKPLLTRRHMNNRLLWAKQNKDRNWNNVIFTDESSIKLFSAPRRVWRRRGEVVKYPSVKHSIKVHIWGCFSERGFGAIHLFTTNLNAKKMCSIYENYLLPTAQNWFGDNTANWVLQEDNDPKHTSKLAKTWKTEHNVNRLPWPAQSPDQNPIEHVWQVLKANVASHHPTNLRQLVYWIRREWNALSITYAQQLVQSMSRRVLALISAKGDNTNY